MSHLHLLGLNHKTAPVEVRERFAVPAAHLGHALSYVKAVPGIKEAAIISTCNRVEIYAFGDAKAGAKLRDSMISYHPFGAARGLENHLHYSQDESAARHLFEVSSGLDSLVLGEAEILGQVKIALESAKNHGAAGAVLDELLRRSIACGKRARSETGISRGALSVGAAAVELAKQIFGSLKGHTVLILGAGKMSGRVAQCLVSSGAHRVLVANRTLERAQELAREFNDEGAGAEAVGWDEFPEKLAQADIVIASTRAPHYVVTREQIALASKKRRRSLLLIDIAVPRDIEPTCNEISDVFLFDIDDLQRVVEEGRKSRANEILRVENIISQEVSAWTKWLGASDVQPVMASLARRTAQIRDAETEIALAKLSHLSDKDRAQVEALARALAGKLMHAPLSHLRNGGAGDGDALRRAFGLDAAGGETEN
ncbi:glutamyl-tRNA reductase [Abditibacterium utsteinense]|uniref:Glutamyl-tRNA reductase n=1 Tax=Abditibacterium utsteinense TaxID=1960156 RepID=A0A2S8SRP9_9BACT|nr:glutamyl-tRNA reductase [Abditibacterium utsteinense]PQV63483.1 glutamyl-tRNA reductase [Abditibacterium utsteinense]